MTGWERRVMLGLAAALIGFVPQGTTEEEPQAKAPSMKPHYQAHTATALGLQVTLEYPAGWRLREEQGTIDLYHQLRISGPRNQDDTYTCFISVRSSPVKSSGGRHEHAGELMKTYTDHLLEGSTVTGEQATLVGGVDGRELTVESTIPAIRHKGIKALPIPVKTRTVFLERNHHLYELIYSADARDYDRYAEAFEHLLKTFRFQ